MVVVMKEMEELEMWGWAPGFVGRRGIAGIKIGRPKVARGEGSRRWCLEGEI